MQSIPINEPAGRGEGGINSLWMNPGQLLIAWDSREVKASKNIPRGAAKSGNPGAGVGRAQVRGEVFGSRGEASEFPRKVPSRALLRRSLVLFPGKSRTER